MAVRAILPRIRGLFLKHRFQRLHSEDSARFEESLAVARLFIVCAAIIAIYVDPTEPSRFVALGYSLLLVNVIYSIGLLLYLRSLGTVSGRLQVYIHSIDVLWAAILSFFSQGPGSVFFAFFILALVAAAYRWYFRETIMTIFVILALLMVEAFLMSHVRELLGGPADVELNRLIVRSAYVLGVGVLVGFLGQKEKLQRAQVTAASRIISRIQGASGLNGAVRAALESILDIYGARSAALAIHYWREEQVMVWRALTVPGGVEINEYHSSDSSVPVIFCTPSSAWCANVDRATGDFETNYLARAAGGCGRWICRFLRSCCLRIRRQAYVQPPFVWARSSGAACFSSIRRIRFRCWTLCSPLNFCAEKQYRGRQFTRCCCWMYFDRGPEP